MKMTGETPIEVSWMEKLSHPRLSHLDLHDLLELLYKSQCKRMEEMSATLKNLDRGRIYMLGKMKNYVVEKSMSIYKTGCFPFVPVLPKGDLFTFYDIIMASSSQEDPLTPSLNLKLIEDVPAHKSPHVIPYIIFNIHIGDDKEGLSPREGLTRIIENKRTPFNLADALAVRFQIDMIKKRPFHVCGSVYRKNLVPGLCSSQYGTLTWAGLDDSKEGWICPSYETSMVAFSWHGVTSPKAYSNFLIGKKE
jgi:hypothetical protein